MSSPRAASRFKVSARRTNSLGSAKTDCHTCSSLKKPCDRQRPQCGTCRHEQRKCGGYVLDLVWKGHSLGEALSSTRNAAGTTVVNGPVSPADLASSERQFKFKQGRPKMKRKSCKCSDVGANGASILRVKNSSSSTYRLSAHIVEKSPRPEHIDEEVLLQPTTATEEYGTWFDHDEQSNLGNY